jgi:hypothetical protein
MRLIALIVSLVFAIAVSEITLRAVDYRPATMDPEMYVKNDDLLLPYKLRPNYRGYCAGKEVNIDPDGYRVVNPNYHDVVTNRNMTPSKDVLLLGDSAVFGFGLNDRQTIASQMQELAFRRKLDYRIKNIGVSGYTSWNEFAATREYLEKYVATHVVVLYVPNDLTFDNDYFGIGKGKAASFSRGESRIHHLTRSLYSNLYTSFLISNGIKRLVSNGQSQAFVFNERESETTINYSMQAIMQIAQLCKSKNINLIVAVYRDVAYYEDPNTWLKYEEFIGRSLDHLGIDWIVAKAHIVNLTQDAAVVAWNDPHPSERAAGLIAEEILEAIQRKHN